MKHTYVCSVKKYDFHPRVSINGYLFSISFYTTIVRWLLANCVCSFIDYVPESAMMALMNVCSHFPDCRYACQNAQALFYALRKEPNMKNFTFGTGCDELCNPNR